MSRSSRAAPAAASKLDMSPTLTSTTSITKKKKELMTDSRCTLRTPGLCSRHEGDYAQSLAASSSPLAVLRHRGRCATNEGSR